MSSDYANPSNLKEELASALKGIDLTSFNFAMEETDSQVTASFTTRKVKEVIMLDEVDKLTLRYTLVKDLKAKTETVSKTEIVKSGKSVEVLIMDIKTGNVLDRLQFPEPESHQHPDEEEFETIEECIDDFRNKHPDLIKDLQIEANRTCESQGVHTHCCLTDGYCYFVIFLIEPTSLRCTSVKLLPSFEAAFVADPNINN